MSAPQNLSHASGSKNIQITLLKILTSTLMQNEITYDKKGS